MNIQRSLAVALLSLSLTTTPIAAQTEETLGEKFKKGLTSENVGKAIGAAAGALLGSQVGKGSGKLAAVAVGTLAGYWIGGEVGRRLSQRDQAGIANTTQQALNTGETQTWRNPDSGVFTRVSVDEAPGYSAADIDWGSEPGGAPTLELINEFYVADANANVRAGPGTDYAILHRLEKGAHVPVVGKVTDSEWHMIAEQDAASGFVHGPLLSRAESQPESHNAIREAMSTGQSPQTQAVEQQRCSIITQEVVLPDGATDTHNFKACQQADGTWVQV